MKIKLDENLSRHLKAPLEQRGHDVTTVVEQRMMGKPDVEVGTAAKSEERMISLSTLTLQTCANSRQETICSYLV